MVKRRLILTTFSHFGLLSLIFSLTRCQLLSMYCAVHGATMLFTEQQKNLSNSKQKHTNLNEIITAIIIIFIGFVIPCVCACDCDYCHWHYVIIIIPRIVLHVHGSVPMCHLDMLGCMAFSTQQFKQTENRTKCQ